MRRSATAGRRRRRHTTTTSTTRRCRRRRPRLILKQGLVVIRYQAPIIQTVLRGVGFGRRLDVHKGDGGTIARPSTATVVAAATCTTPFFTIFTTTAAAAIFTSPGQ